MVRIWWKLMTMRINDYKRYEDKSVLEAANAVISTFNGDNSG